MSTLKAACKVSCPELSVGLSRERTQSMLHHMADTLSAEHVCHEKRCEHTNYIGRIYIDVPGHFVKLPRKMLRTIDN